MIIAWSTIMQQTAEASFIMWITLYDKYYEHYELAERKLGGGQ